jgi:FG-GAP-like repeat/PKD domain
MMTKTLGRLARAYVAFAVCLAVSSALAATCPASNDFNNDGKSDVLWRKSDSSGNDYIFLMNAASVTGGGYTNSVPDPKWQIVGTGDFDGDGKADILWRKSDTGDDYIFLMNGTTVQAGSNYTNAVPDTHWKVAGIGDFDGDGKADILWRNNATGQNYIFFMNGTTVRTTSGYTNTVDTSWTVAGIGDLDGDGKSDILWRNSVTGQDYIFFMNGATVQAASRYTNTVDTSWTVAGIGDFDGDGKADILWRNSDSGEDYIFFMNGATVLGSSGYTNSVASPWTIVGTGDHNGDGKADILWRNPTDGNDYVFLMNGLTVQPGSGYTNAVPDLTWGVVPAAAMVGSTACGSVTPTIVPSRTSGVAPLAVFFDASGTTGKGTTAPFDEIEYRWDFGDPVGGAAGSCGSPVAAGTGYWACGAQPGGLSKNVATGPEAAHVFETPGTYTVTLAAYDGASTRTTTLQITVSDADSYYSGASTTCVTNGSDFSGCPSGANRATSISSWTTAAGYLGTGKRVLLRRGDTFTTSNDTAIKANGPWLIGAYGSGQKPIIQATSSSTQMLQIGDKNNPGRSEATVMDLTFDGNGSKGTIGISNANGDGNIGTFNRQLILRCDFHDIGTAMMWDEDLLDYWNSHGDPGNTVWDQIFIFDNTGVRITGGSPHYNLYVAAKHLAVMGNSFNNSGTGSHTVRVTYTDTAVFGDNTITGGALGYDLFKMHAKNWNVAGVSNPGGVGTYTQNVVITDNKFIEYNEDLMVGIGPEDDGSTGGDERVRQVLFERNMLLGAHNGYTLYWAMSSDTTIRNNIFNATGMGTHEPLSILRRAAGLTTPNNVQVYNNTFYDADSGSDFTAINVDNKVTNVTLKNNLGYAPSDGSHKMLAGSGGGGLVTGNNSTNAQVGTPSFSFANSTPSAPADFRPTSGYAVGGGASVPVWSDMLRTTEPSPRDMGAVNH